MSRAVEYVQIVQVYDLGPDATDSDLDEYCDAVTDWLTEHEGDELSISVRPARRGEVSGTFYLRAGVPSGPSLRSAYPDPEEERVLGLLEEAWQRWCEGTLGDETRSKAS